LEEKYHLVIFVKLVKFFQI